MSLTLLQTYNVLERVSFAFLALKVTFILVACIMVKPDWAAALVGLVLPRVPEYPEWAAGLAELKNRPPLLEIAVLLGTVGGGLQDYIGYVGCMREKPWGAADAPQGGVDRMPDSPDQVRAARTWLRAPAADVVFSFLAVLVLCGSFMLLGAAVLNPQHELPTRDDLYSRQA
jgi:hypothetical protein